MVQYRKRIDVMRGYDAAMSALICAGMRSVFLLYIQVLITQQNVRTMVNADYSHGTPISKEKVAP